MSSTRRRAEEAAGERRRAVDERHPDPGPSDGDYRDSGDVHHRDPAGGAPPGADAAGPYDQGRSPPPSAANWLEEGQVFFVHNRVQDIEKTAAQLRSGAEATIVTAHGQMSERQLGR